MGALDARVLLVLAATCCAGASDAVVLVDVECDSGIVDFEAATLTAACGGRLSAELRGVPGDSGSSYSLNVLAPPTPFVLLSELNQNVVKTMALSGDDIPSEGEMNIIELTGDMPPTKLCGTGFLVVAFSDGKKVTQQLLSGPIPCADEAVDLTWEFPKEGMPAITITPGQPIETDLVLKLKNSGTTGLQERLPLDSPEVKIIVAGEGTVPHYFVHETNMSMAEMSTSLLQTMRHLLLDGAPDAMAMMGRATGAEMLLVAEDFTKSRDLPAGSTVDLDLSTLTVSPMKTFSYSYGLPGALIIVADPFNRTNDVDRSNNFAVILVNFTSSGQEFDMDAAEDSVTKECKVMPSIDDGGRSALLVSLHSMPYMFDDKTFGFSMANTREVHDQLKGSFRSDQLEARLNAMDLCSEEAFVATGEDADAAAKNSVLAHLLLFLTSLREDAENLQVQGDVAAQQHNTTLLIATALEDVLTTALDGDDKSKAFILQILVYKMKSFMMSHGMGKRPDKPMGGGFGPRDRPGRGMGFSQGGPGGRPGGMSGFPGGMNNYPGGAGGSFGGMSGSFGGMSGPGSGRGNGFVQRDQAQSRANFGRRGQANGGNDGNGGRNEGRNGGGNEGRNGGGNEGRNGGRNRGRPGGGSGGRRNTTNSQRPSIAPMTTSTSTTLFRGNGGVDDGLAMAGRSPADWGVQSDGTFRCKNGELVDMFQVKCDGMKDCSDGSDEIECTGRSKRHAGEDHDDDDDDDDDIYDDDDEDDEFQDNDIDDDDDDDDDDDARDGQRQRGQRRRGERNRRRDSNRRGRDDDDDDDDDDDNDDDDNDVDDEDDVIDIFVDLIMEAGDESDNDITIEKFEEALEDIADETGRLPPAINEILGNSVLEMGAREKPFTTAQMKKSAASTLFIAPDRYPPRFGRDQRFRGRGRGEGHRCSPFQKEKLEMKKVVSLMFMQLMTKAPEDMKGFTFLPLSLRRSVKQALTAILTSGPPMVFKPFYVVLQNNTELQKMVGMMYIQTMLRPGTTKLETIFDFWRNNMTKVVRDELQGDAEMLELLDLAEQYMDLMKPRLKEMYEYSDMMKTMMMVDKSKVMAFLNARPGAEPSDEERCMRLARMAAEAMQASQMSVRATQATLFESPFDMVVADQTNEGGVQSPVYWRVEKQAVLRGERWPITGNMMWAKVAVCSCKDSFPPPPFFPPNMPFPAFGFGSGSNGPGDIGPGAFGQGSKGPGGFGPDGGFGQGGGPGGFGQDGGPGGFGEGGGPGGFGEDRGPGGFGEDGGPGGFGQGMGSDDMSGFGWMGQGTSGGGGRGSSGRGRGGGRGRGMGGIGGFIGGGQGWPFGASEGERGNGFGMGQGGGAVFGIDQGGFRGYRGNGFGNPFGRRNLTNGWDDNTGDDDDSDYDYDNDNDNDVGPPGGQPIIFSGESGISPSEVNNIQQMLQNALMNPDGSINYDALKDLLESQGTGSTQPRSSITPNSQAAKPGFGNIDITSVKNAINNIRGNKASQSSNQGSGSAQPSFDINTFRNIFASQGGGAGQATNSQNNRIFAGKSNRPFSFGQAALQQGNANSAQVVQSQETKSHLELNRRSEMELDDGTLEVSGEVLVSKERDDSSAFEMGSVCDDGWGKEEATVVCNIIAARLSKNSAPLVRAEATATAHRTSGAKSPYKELEAPIKLDGVKCVGNETDILQCKHQGWGDHDCHNNEKASVTCIVR